LHARRDVIARNYTMFKANVLIGSFSFAHALVAERQECQQETAALREELAELREAIAASGFGKRAQKAGAK
jgi:hypothetical protein